MAKVNFKKVEPLQVDLDKALQSAAAAHRASNLMGLTYRDPETGSIYDATELTGDDVWGQTSITKLQKEKAVSVSGTGPLVRILDSLEKELKNLGTEDTTTSVSEVEDEEFATAIGEIDQPISQEIDNNTKTIKTLKIKRKVVLDIIITRSNFERSFEAARKADLQEKSEAAYKYSIEAEARRKAEIEKRTKEILSSPETAAEPIAKPKVILG